ncbi:hypothetical protein SAMN06297422_1385 [Lachnospiraceae bacterium]|nr:hypothetical protein SAMN06297422_1385 [Lachnospiraceae bacterium]
MGIQIYGTETVSTVNGVICPLSGQFVDDTYSYMCMYCDCSNVKSDMFYELEGKRYRCPAEKRLIEMGIERRQRKQNIRERFTNSYESSLGINVGTFEADCNELNEYLVNHCASYEDINVKPYRGEDEIHIVYSYENGELKHIAKTENLMSMLAKYMNEANKKNAEWSASYALVNNQLIDAIIVNLYLRYNFDVVRVLDKDNPIYIKNRDVYKYLENVYGLNQHDFKKILKNNLWMTSILNYNSVIYVKQELDQIIRRGEQYWNK